MRIYDSRKTGDGKLELRSLLVRDPSVHRKNKFTLKGESNLSIKIDVGIFVRLNYSTKLVLTTTLPVSNIQVSMGINNNH